jgi:hypothetical protein
LTIRTTEQPAFEYLTENFVMATFARFFLAAGGVGVLNFVAQDLVPLGISAATLWLLFSTRSLSPRQSDAPRGRLILSGRNIE